MNPESLDSRLLAAHQADDKPELVRLYTFAGDKSEEAGNIDAACFYLTQAFVFALETGAPEADLLNKRLWEYGRAHRLAF